MKRRLPPIGAALLALLFGGCQRTSSAPSPAWRGAHGKVRAVSATEIAKHLRYLASDALGGRGVGTPGIDKAAAYHEQLFRRWGLAPAFGGSYRQGFEVRGSRPDPQASLSFSTPKGAITPKRHDEFVLFGARQDCARQTSGSLVYVGYGIKRRGAVGTTSRAPTYAARCS